LLNRRKREKLTTRGLETESVGFDTIDDVPCGVESVDRRKWKKKKRDSLTLVCAV